MFAELKDPVRRKIERYGLTRTIDPRPLLPDHRIRRRRLPPGNGRRMVQRLYEQSRQQQAFPCGRVRDPRTRPRGYRIARVTAFGVSNVAPSGAVVGGLVIVIGYAGFAAPLVVLIAFVASLCCAVSIAEFARRLPSAGSLYTYNSRGLGGTGGFLTGWMMVFASRCMCPLGWR